MNSINFGYSIEKMPQTEKDAENLSLWIAHFLGYTASIAPDLITPEKTEKCMQGLDILREKFPEVFRRYELIDDKDGVRLGDYEMWDYRNEFTYLERINENC
jgi:hypothetical protein